MTLHLPDDDPLPVAPFTSTDHPRRWVAPTATLAGLESPPPDGLTPEPYPALVALGHTGTSTVLLNLEAAGTLRLDGPRDIVDATLRALVAELATSELSGRIGLTADTEFSPLARACAPARLQAGAPSVAAHQLADRLADAAAALGHDGLDDTLQTRSDRRTPDLWLPVVYLDDDPTATCAPWSGSILLTRAPGVDGWTLDLGVDGIASLAWLGLRFTVARLTPSGLEAITELLPSAAPEPDAAPPEQPLPGDLEALNALAELGHMLPATTSSDQVEGLRIQVLGPVRLANLPPGQAEPSERQTELLAFLALRGPSAGPEIDEALWPGKREEGQARYGLIYRTRRCVLSHNLPRTEQGAPTLLGPNVACDWHEFRRLAARGLAAGPAGVEDLRSALSLVRGRPFTGVRAGTYGWADRETDEMISAIADVAHTLSRRLTETGDTRGALTAATIGLSVDPCSDRLRDDAVAAALAHGDAAEAHRINERYNALLAELDDELV